MGNAFAGYSTWVQGAVLVAFTFVLSVIITQLMDLQQHSWQPPRPHQPLHSSILPPIQRKKGAEANSLFCVEIFAVTASLTAVIRQLGMRHSFGIDHKIHFKLVGPIIYLDLFLLFFFEYAISLIWNQRCMYVHFAPPCGTGSYAKFIKKNSNTTLQFCTQMSTQVGLPTSPMSSKPESKLQTIYTISLSICAELAMNMGCCFQLRILPEVSYGTQHPYDLLRHVFTTVSCAAQGINSPSWLITFPCY